MYDRVGSKLKAVAKVAAWLGIISSCISGITIISAGSRMSYSGVYGSSAMGAGGLLGGVVVIVVGSLFSWLSSLALYGFGELIEKATEMNEKLSSIAVPDKNRS